MQMCKRKVKILKIIQPPTLAPTRRETDETGARCEHLAEPGPLDLQRVPFCTCGGKVKPFGPFRPEQAVTGFHLHSRL